MITNIAKLLLDKESLTLVLTKEGSLVRMTLVPCGGGAPVVAVDKAENLDRELGNAIKAMVEVIPLSVAARNLRASVNRKASNHRPTSNICQSAKAPKPKPAMPNLTDPALFAGAQITLDRDEDSGETLDLSDLGPEPLEVTPPVPIETAVEPAEPTEQPAPSAGAQMTDEELNAMLNS
jgi:hypothetical protein